MKINKLFNKKRTVIAIVAVLALSFVGWLTATHFTGQTLLQSENESDTSKDVNSVDYNVTTDQQKESAQQAKVTFLDKLEDKQQDQEAKSSISITNVGQEGDILRVRTVIATTSTEGTCRLTLAREGELSVSNESSIQDMGSYFTCMGFDIDTKSLKKGAWELELEYTGDADGVIIQKTTEIK